MRSKSAAIAASCAAAADVGLHGGVNVCGDGEVGGCGGKEDCEGGGDDTGTEGDGGTGTERSSVRSLACAAGQRASAYSVHVSADALVSWPAARNVDIWQSSSFIDMRCSGTSEMFERTNHSVSFM